MMSTSTALYLSLDYIKSPTDLRIVLLKCTNPCNITTVGGSNGWTYVGTALTKEDGESFGVDQEFSVIDMATLQRTNGVPDVVTMVNGDAGSFGGACTYLPSASKAGVIRGQLLPTLTEKISAT